MALCPVKIYSWTLVLAALLVAGTSKLSGMPLQANLNVLHTGPMRST